MTLVTSNYKINQLCQYIKFNHHSKALCHALSTDCLLVEAAHMYTINDTGCGRWLMSLHVQSSPPTEACGVY